MRDEHLTPEPERLATDCYDKPIWTIASLVGSLGGLPRHLRRVAPTLVGKPIDNRLREMIMLAVATENRCWYCQTAHASFGEATGLRPDEVETLLAGDDGDATMAERAALHYVRDLAQRGFRSHDAELRAKLHEHFDDEQCDAIESTAHVMNFANRFGNTFDAARTRAMGRCAASGGSTFDLIVISAVFVPAAASVAPIVGLLRLLKLLRGSAAERARGAH